MSKIAWVEKNKHEIEKVNIDIIKYSTTIR